MTARPNTRVILKQVPDGIPVPDRDFEVVPSTITIRDVEPEPGEILIRVLYLSIEPVLRFLMNPNCNYSTVEVGKPVPGSVVAEVIKTNDHTIKEGDIVMAGAATWEEYTILNSTLGDVKVIPLGRKSSYPLSYFLGILGTTGLTAYIGLHKICEPLQSPDGKQQTLFVSAASGAVGHIVGQYAKILGLRVVGCVSDDDKAAYLLSELNFDAVFNYKKHEDWGAIVKKTCPSGIDIYFDNVGGRMLDAVLLNANNFARIAVCGQISQYSRVGNPEPVYTLPLILSKRIRIEGFRYSDDAGRYAEEAIRTLTEFLKAGKIVAKETVTDGLENAPKAFVDMLQGKNIGKAIVKVADL